jgi:hypothetical protein
VNDDRVYLIGNLIDSEEGIDDDLGLILLVALLSHIVLKPIDGNDKVIGEL